MQKSRSQLRVALLWVSCVGLVVSGAVSQSAMGSAQPGSRTFAETGKTVKGRFLEYWTDHGGLMQQGYPISEEMQERSETDGKTYTVQYFERAVFEAHPENQEPYDVLLSLLGMFSYGARYPGRAPNQKANTETGSRLFPETGKRVGGVFLKYWNDHGGLMQQGYPISEEFQERSALDGKMYTVQYFERAVFEAHPENQEPYNVLLSQLGTFRYRARYAAGATTPTSRTPTPVASNPGWSRIGATNEGPAARRDHTAVYDPVRKRLVVFGGRGGGKTYADTWVFDFATGAWREVRGEGPPARFGHGAVYDAANGRMIVVMGQGQGTNFFNDVWAFDLEREIWAGLIGSRNDANSPRTRYGQSAALDGRGRVLISHGFSDQGRFDDTWAFDMATGRWVNLTPSGGPRPLKRCLHEMVYDAAADRVILFGGCSSGFGPCPQGDMWAFDLRSGTWTELKPGGAKPAARSNPSLVLDPVGKQILLFGGETANGASAEAWRYGLEGNAWSQAAVNNGPSARASQGTAHDREGRRVIVFGGETPGGVSNEVWQWRY